MDSHFKKQDQGIKYVVCACTDTYMFNIFLIEKYNSNTITLTSFKCTIQ